MGIINLRQSKALEGQIDELLDTISRASLVFRRGVQEYLEGATGPFEETIAEMARQENRADELRRSIESRLYLHSLIPEMRGDVLGLLESMDTVINSEKKTLLQFSVEMPAIPAEFHSDFLTLTDVIRSAAEEMITAVRAYFHDFNMVKNSLHKVYYHEKEADRISDRLKRSIFASGLDLGRKIHLRYFALHIENISDYAEDVADRLTISSIKRSY